MDRLRLLVLDGDGVGPEVNAQALRVIEAVTFAAGIALETTHASFGGQSIDEHGGPVTDEVLAAALEHDAVLLGAVGGPKWDDLPASRRPEKGLLRLRSTLGVYANIRPARCFDALTAGSPLKAERVRGVDFVVVRELIGGIYFGEPRGIEATESGRRGFNTMVYEEAEIARVARLAFEMAGRRQGRLTSVDKANVLEVSGLWRQVVTELAADYPDVALSHYYVDNCAMQIIRDPRAFDVIVTGNLFGDILSDISGALTGSLGMLPSASIGDGPALYEPVHGSAPDIAGRNVANPLAAILSVAMLAEHTLGRRDLALAIERAVEAALAEGYRTRDLLGSGSQDDIEVVGTDAMADAVLRHLNAVGEELVSSRERVSCRDLVSTGAVSGAGGRR